MRMSNDHYEFLLKKVESFIAQYGLDYFKAYKIELANNPKVKDADMRFAFDLFYACKVHQVYSYCEFDYLDVHIYTAMRKIIKETGL